jgi:hypothetical protein
LGGPQGHSGRGSEEKNYQPPLEIEPYNPDRPARSPEMHYYDEYPQFSANVNHFSNHFLNVLAEGKC